MCAHVYSMCVCVRGRESACVCAFRSPQGQLDEDRCAAVLQLLQGVVPGEESASTGGVLTDTSASTSAPRVSTAVSSVRDATGEQERAALIPVTQRETNRQSARLSGVQV